MPICAPTSRPRSVDYIVYAPSSAVQDFTPYTRLKAVLNLWAGVEDVVGNATLTVPLARMVDHGLTQGMVEWVTGHVLRHHLGIDAHLAGQDGVWRKTVPPLAQDRGVVVLGLGELGLACGAGLAGLGFDVTGWSRSPKTEDGDPHPARPRGVGRGSGPRRDRRAAAARHAATRNILNARDPGAAAARAR